MGVGFDLGSLDFWVLISSFLFFGRKHISQLGIWGIIAKRDKLDAIGGSNA